MNYEEAINVLSSKSCYACSYGCQSPATCDCEKCELKDAIKQATAALNKQILLKPISGFDGFDFHFTCPTCAADTTMTLYAKKQNPIVSCPVCGQRLDLN